RVIRPTIALFFILNFMIESNTFVLINASHLICSFPEGNGEKPVTGKSSAPALKVRVRISPDTENQLLSINLGRLPDILDKRGGKGETVNRVLPFGKWGRNDRNITQRKFHDDRGTAAT